MMHSVALFAACKLTFPNLQRGRATGPVMTTTTMPVAIGTEETVADPTTTSSARNANAKTVRLWPNPMNVRQTSEVLARPNNSRETAFVTTGA